MKQSKLQVYDPPMCCSSGVCGPKVDPELVRFSSDIDWLKKQSVAVERFNLSSHPAEFVRQECVREALTKEGNDCLPLIVAGGVIVSRGIYPSRQELMKFAGISGSTGKEMADSKDDPAPCGPGCACNVPSGGKGIKTAISLIVLVAVAGILIYKASSAKSAASSASSAVQESGFPVTQNAPTAARGVNDAAPTAQPDEHNAGKQQPAKVQNRIGAYLESLGDLNKVAMNQDAVFIFIPKKKSEVVQGQTSDAVLAAQNSLKRSNITVGLYTLAAGAPDYAGIAKQVQAPAILIVTKGRGMAVVSGEVTETKLLQAFMATTSAGGCGSSCGPSSAGCK